MAWFKMDDQLYGHKKTRRAGVEAMGLWAICGAWSAAHEEDGFVPDYIAENFTTKANLYADRLVKAGFWEKTEKDGDNGWQFHDWNQYQPTADQQEARREQWRERQRSARSRKQVSRESHADVTRESRESHGESHAPVTESRPVPSRPVKDTSASDDAGFIEWWASYPRKVGRGQAWTAYKRAAKKTTPDALLAAAVTYSEQTRGSEPKFIAHPATWLNGERWLDEPPSEPEGLTVAQQMGWC